MRPKRLIPIAALLVALAATALVILRPRQGQLAFLYESKPRSIKISETTVRNDRTNRALSFTFPPQRSEAVKRKLRLLADRKGWRIYEGPGACGGISGNPNGIYAISWDVVADGQRKARYEADGMAGDLRVTVHENEPWLEQKLHQMRHWLGLA